MLLFSFFFQAEDGIRDGHVTGVQTCALPIFELAPDHFVVVHVDEHRPAEQLPFEEVRDEVESAARQELASRRAAELAETLLAALDQGAELAELAPERGLAWQRAQQVQRADPTVQTEA